MTSPTVVLAVAGTDSGGAAGLAADLATIGHLGAHAACVVTAVTAQDTTGVQAVHPVPPETVAAQVDSVLGDLPVAAVKAGMLGGAEPVRVVADRLGHLPLVVDPVLVATSGAVLGTAEVRRAYVDRLLPVATVTTPNRGEARALLGLAEDDPTPAPELATRLADLGCAVVVTGGPDGGRPPIHGERCTDWLARDGEVHALTHPALDTRNDHGTGCTYSSALATHLALGEDLTSAAAHATAYTTRQLETSQDWTLGRGRGPVAHTSRTTSPTRQEITHARP